MRIKIILVTIVFCLLAISPALFGQTSGNMRGEVTDPDGRPIPGAQITISSPALIGGTKTTYTNESGVFRFPSLPVGTYSVIVTMDSFETVQVARVEVGLNATANVPLTMKMAAMAEQITVVGETPVIDVTESGYSTSFKNEILEEVPTQRTFTDLMQVAPGVSGSTGDSNGDRTIAFGSNMQSNSWNIDGMDLSAPETGSVWLYNNPDTIEEIQIIGVGAPAEYGNHTGAVFNVVTKKGGNTVHGGAGYFYKGDDLTATNVTLSDAEPPDARVFHEVLSRNFSGQMGGPIKKDKLWFFGSYEYARDAFTNPGEDPAFANTAKTDRYDIKLSGLLGQNHEVSGFYHREDWTSPSNANQYISPGAVYQERGHDNGWGAGITSTLSSNFLLEARYAGWNTHDLSDSPTGTLDPSFIDYSPPGGGPATYSGGRYYPFDYKTDRHQGNVKATYYAENFLNSQHEFRFGVQYSRGYADTLVAAGPDGYYNYHYAYDYYGYIYDYFYRAFQLPFNYGAVTKDLGFFLDDTITVNDRLTLNLGVRFDHNTGDFPEFATLAIGTPSVSPVGNFVLTGDTVPGLHVMTWDKVSPRVGFVLQTRKDGKAILQGSFGVYYDHNVSGNWDYPSPSTTAFEVYYYDPVTNQLGDLVYEIAPDKIAFDPDIQPPRTLQYSIGYEHQIRDDLGIGVQYIYKDTENLIGWETVGGEWSPELFTDPISGNTYTVLNLVSNPVLRKGNRPFSGIPEFSGSENGRNYYQTYQGVILSLTKRLSNNWTMNASYTWSESKGLIPRPLSQTQFNPFYSSKEGSDPNQWINADGHLQGDRPHMFRVQSVFFLPWDMQASVAADFSSGRHYNRVFRISLDQGGNDVIMERGFRHPAIQAIDVAFGKKFFLNDTIHVRFDAAVFNLLNTDNSLSLATQRLAVGDQFVNDLWSKPRRLQLRIGLQF